MIRYDLSGLDPAVRVEVMREVNRRGILNTYVDHVLSVSEEFEAAVDELVTIEELRAESQKESEEYYHRVQSGAEPPSCETCGRIPAAQLVMRRQVGMVVVSKTETYEGVLCRQCGDNLRRWVQKQSALKGWTGVKSALMNPVVMGVNERNYAKFLHTLDSYS